MKKINQQRGITLVALVITIIILLILAGISISALTGSGLFGKAKDSKLETEIAREKEQIKMSVMSEMTNTEYNNVITIEGLENELKKYDDEVTVVQVDTIPNGATIVSKTNKKIELKDLFITTSYAAEDSKYAKVTYKSERVYYVEIKGDNIGRIYEDPDNKDNTTTGSTPEEPETPSTPEEPASPTEPGEDNPPGGETTYTAYTRGQELTVVTKDGVEQSFYVLNDSSSSEATVTLLAAKNINISTFLQDNALNPIVFSSNNVWAEGENLNNNGTLKTDESSAVYYAVQYGKKFEGGTGRLMTLGEILDITGLTTAGKITSPSWIIGKQNYWLGSANDTDSTYVWNVNHGSSCRLSSVNYDAVNSYGVRPVIVISKTKIQ